MKTAFFIVGTDTGVGKTHVMCHLAKVWGAARVLKPVATGCVKHISDDVLAYKQRLPQTVNISQGWSFEPPVSPHLAAALDSTHLSAEKIAAWCHAQGVDKPGMTLIEGAGGLLVPLNEQETWLEVLQRLKIPVLVVVGIRLGCLNHALLTVHVLKSAGIQIAGWVANHVDPDCLYPDEVVETLIHRIDAPCLFRLPYEVPSVNTSQLACCMT